MNPFVIAFRRIIYSIPLKRLLLGLAIFAVLFACFSSAENVEDLIVKYCSDGTTNCQYSFDKTINSSYSNILSNLPDGKNFCFNITSSSNPSVQLSFSFNSTSNNQNPLTTFSAWTNWGNDIFICGRSTTYLLGKVLNSSDNVNIKGDVFILSDLLATALPVYTSLECQQEYNLIPVESVDQNYCTTNNLCPAGTPSDCPNVGVSNLYINDIFHPGAFNVIMNIPEEIDWDYAYTNSGQNFNLDVVGYNQDFEKIEGWIETNNYKPTSEDFTNIFTSFSSFGGLLIACLFVILVFYFIKKLFK